MAKGTSHTGIKGHQGSTGPKCHGRCHKLSPHPKGCLLLPSPSWWLSQSPQIPIYLINHNQREKIGGFVFKTHIPPTRQNVIHSEHCGSGWDEFTYIHTRTGWVHTCTCMSHTLTWVYTSIVLVPFLLPWQSAIKDSKHLIWGSGPKVLEAMIIMVGSMIADRQETATVAKNPHIDLQERDKDRDTGSGDGVSFWNFKTHTPCNIAPLIRPQLLILFKDEPLRDVLIQISTFYSLGPIDSWLYHNAKCIYFNFKCSHGLPHSQHCLEIQSLFWDSRQPLSYTPMGSNHMPPTHSSSSATPTQFPLLDWFLSLYSVLPGTEVLALLASWSLQAVVSQGLSCHRPGLSGYLKYEGSFHSYFTPLFFWL